MRWVKSRIDRRCHSKVVGAKYQNIATFLHISSRGNWNETFLHVSATRPLTFVRGSHRLWGEHTWIFAESAAWKQQKRTRNHEETDVFHHEKLGGIKEGLRIFQCGCDGSHISIYVKEPCYDWNSLQMEHPPISYSHLNGKKGMAMKKKVGMKSGLKSFEIVVFQLEAKICHYLQTSQLIVGTFCWTWLISKPPMIWPDWLW